MSSLDSALNSLSAATMKDFIAPHLKDSSRFLLISKLTTVSWGVLITGFAFLVGSISETVIESINKIGSAFYGPVLAAFVVGVLSRTATARSVTVGILSGVGFNLLLWFTSPGIYWMWWNLFGFLIAAGVCFLVALMDRSPRSDDISDYVLQGTGLFEAERQWLPAYVILILYFLLILATLLLI
jgi:SSS family solute:Na+ symporter